LSRSHGSPTRVRASFGAVTAAPDYLSSPETLRAALGDPSASDVVLLAAQALRVGSLDYAAAICEAYAGPKDAALSLTLAAALFGSGEQARAVALVDEVLAEQPAHLAALFYRAQMAQAQKEPGRAIELLLAVLARFPDFPGAHGALASLRLPGPPYRDVLRRLHELLAPRSYLEIGVETGATLAFAHGAERAIGIDPDASKLRRELVPACARVFHETSDDFFARVSREQAFGARPVDLSFIDGMHWFEYALRDFINAEAWSAPDGTVVLHDCLPIFPLTASRERKTKFWVGDVWKVVSILREHRPDLRVKIVATAPSGLCVVRGLDPKSRVLAEGLATLIERYRDVPYPAGALEVPPGFELVPASDAGLREALR
jgi:Methyltransferase domain